ncbi:MAG: hypothetical protein N3A38_00585, partial [Planctomycetota bacterium]|nr:hypothetical protein [Planctomycetota bacterium]
PPPKKSWFVMLLGILLIPIAAYLAYYQVRHYREHGTLADLLSVEEQRRVAQKAGADGIKATEEARELADEARQWAAKARVEMDSLLKKIKGKVPDTQELLAIADAGGLFASDRGSAGTKGKPAGRKGARAGAKKAAGGAAPAADRPVSSAGEAGRAAVEAGAAAGSAEIARPPGMGAADSKAAPAMAGTSGTAGIPAPGPVAGASAVPAAPQPSRPDVRATGPTDSKPPAQLAAGPADGEKNATAGPTDTAWRERNGTANAGAPSTERPHAGAGAPAGAITAAGPVAAKPDAAGAGAKVETGANPTANAGGEPAGGEEEDGGGEETAENPGTPAPPAGGVAAKAPESKPGSYEKAVEIYNETLKHYRLTRPGNPPDQVQRELKYSEKKFREVLELLDKARRENPKDGRIEPLEEQCQMFLYDCLKRQVVFVR